jgi:hypothetical protein
VIEAARRLLAVAVAGGLMSGATGCATSLAGLQFHNDHRMTIITPHENEKVVAPVSLRWTMKNFTVAGPRQGPINNGTGYFAIFVDRSPVRPGQTLAAVNHRNSTCAHSTLCLSRSYLASEQVYTTTKAELVLPQVADISGNQQSVQFHTATVVLMNTAGHRIGESAWTVEFKMHTEGGS